MKNKVYFENATNGMMALAICLPAMALTLFLMVCARNTVVLSAIFSCMFWVAIVVTFGCGGYVIWNLAKHVICRD